MFHVQDHKAFEANDLLVLWSLKMTMQTRTTVAIALSLEALSFSQSALLLFKLTNDSGSASVTMLRCEDSSGPCDVPFLHTFPRNDILDAELKPD